MKEICNLIFAISKFNKNAHESNYGQSTCMHSAMKLIRLIGISNKNKNDEGVNKTFS